MWTRAAVAIPSTKTAYRGRSSPRGSLLPAPLPEETSSSRGSYPERSENAVAAVRFGPGEPDCVDVGLKSNVDRAQLRSPRPGTYAGRLRLRVGGLGDAAGHSALLLLHVDG